MEGEALMDVSEENDRSGTQDRSGNDLLGSSSMLLKPQSGVLVLSHTFSKEQGITNASNDRFE